jgi:hypothetical protein
MMVGCHFYLPSFSQKTIRVKEKEGKRLQDVKAAPTSLIFLLPTRCLALHEDSTALHSWYLMLICLIETIALVA